MLSHGNLSPSGELEYAAIAMGIGGIAETHVIMKKSELLKRVYDLCEVERDECGGDK